MIGSIPSSRSAASRNATSPPPGSEMPMFLPVEAGDVGDAGVLGGEDAEDGAAGVGEHVDHGETDQGGLAEGRRRRVARVDVAGQPAAPSRRRSHPWRRTPRRGPAPRSTRGCRPRASPTTPRCTCPRRPSPSSGTPARRPPRSRPRPSPPRQRPPRPRSRRRAPWPPRRPGLLRHDVSCASQISFDRCISGTVAWSSWSGVLVIEKRSRALGVRRSYGAQPQSQDTVSLWRHIPSPRCSLGR